jgi:hypothetical protein
MRWFQTLASLAALVAGGLAAVYAAGPALGSGPVTAIEVEASAVPLDATDPGASLVGRLRYLGGLELTSRDQRFGGISALLWEPACRRLLAISDTGNWLILVPREDGERLVGIEAGWMAPLLSPAGRRAPSKFEADAEALARTPAGETLVFYELSARAEAYAGVTACDPETLAQPASRRWVPADVPAWPANGGMEAAAALGEELLILAESAPGAAGGRAGLIAAPGSAEARRLSYATPTGHEPTAMDALDPVAAPGRMLVLHRRFSPLTGVSVILSEADFAAPLPALVEPREIARFAPPLAVDNMEGIAVRAEGARRFVYLVSDNNFNPLQRTLLLKFELLPEGDAASPPR